jgi:heme-degrading monooxygenase HmoA
MPFIAVTRLRVRDAAFRDEFLAASFECAAQAEGAPGHLDADYLADADDAFWTVTAWASEQAMRDYVRSAPHRDAMPRLRQWCDEATTVSWEQATALLPGWDDAHGRITTAGRVSRVDEPSEAHADRAFPVPVV